MTDAEAVAHELREDVHHSSASQVDTFDDCNRKWAWRYVGGIKPPPNIYAAAGTKLHDVAKAWLQRGELPPPGSEIAKVFAPMVQHMPKPGECTEVDDSRFELRTEAGIIVGYVDAEVPPERRGGVPEVYDWKTTTDLRYAKPAEVLDAQRTIYGVRVLERWNVEAADLVWVYTQRSVDKATGEIIAPKRPKAIAIRVRVDVAKLDKPWARVLRTVEDMGRARASGRTPKDYDYNPTVCDKYGGCPFVLNCNLTPAERLRGHMSAMTLKDRMKARGGDTAPAQPQTPAPAAAASPVTKAPGPINPPEAALPPPATPAPAPKQGTLASLFGAKKAGPMPAAAPAPVVAQAPVQADPPAIPTPSPLPAPSATVKREVQAPATSPWSKPDGFALFVDCAPIKTSGGVMLSFATLIEPVLERLAVEHGVPHYRMIKDSYGAAPAIFATALGEYLTATPLPAHASIAMSLASQEARDGYETMVAFAGLVVRGM